MSWSADGRRIVFERFNIYRCSELFVMNARGEPLHQLTNNHHCDSGPAWSPRGDRI
jgi:Tol biopolymer transport system component